MVDAFLKQIVAWTEAEQNIVGVALVGSFANGTPKPDSDIDLILLADDPGRYLNDTQWVAKFGNAHKIEFEDWGKVISLRVRYEGFKEVEFSFTTPDWANIPIDAGTAKVASNGLKILYDPDNLFNKLMLAIDHS